MLYVSSSALMAALQQLFYFGCLLSRPVSRIQSFVHQCEYFDPGNIILTYLNFATVLVQNIYLQVFSAKYLVQFYVLVLSIQLRELGNWCKVYM